MKKESNKEYLVNDDELKKQQGYIWNVAIGLQQVDGLKTSTYLKDVAKQNIKGNISFDEVKKLINSYYEIDSTSKQDTFEADKVSVNIAQLLLDKSFSFSISQYIDIHKQLFNGVYDHAGKLRTFNISKKEWVLDGQSVVYGGYSLLLETLKYDFNEEKNFDYSKLSMDEFIKHIARFISNLWQIHIFAEGNTRTTAIFLIKYLETLGFLVSNEPFANNAWYFRNSLVRANYTNINKNIYETTSYLELFLRNLLLNEKNDLKNRYLHINWNANNSNVKLDSFKLSNKLKEDIKSLYENLKELPYFSRNELIDILKISNSGASKLIKKLLDKQIIIHVFGHGKGKYRFNNI